MEAYGRSAFEVFQADSLTVLPYMGSDILPALTPWLKEGKGIYLVWLSSNASGKEVQLQWTKEQKTLAEVILESFQCRSADLGVENSFGLVLGATMLDQLTDKLWDLAQKYPLLLPGLGAQGAKPDHPRIKKLSQLGSNLFPISRSLTGLGDQGHDFANARLLSEYQQALDCRISSYLKPLEVNYPQPVS